ncbi:MAG: site-specific integrase [Rhodoferax sp.]|uniref:site-specific integrase n=1 Tax=Rhodoferax sp. TaxID=50421 RepID=UPI00301735DC
MGALAGAGNFDGNRHAQLKARLAVRLYIILPISLIKISGQKMAGIVGQQWIPHPPGDTMNAHEALWLEVRRGLPGLGDSDQSALTRFLATLDCPHAKLLCGQKPAGDIDEHSALVLEQAVCEHARQKKVSRQIAAQWLRWIHLALKILRATANEPITLTKLAILPRLPTSPFSPAQTALCRPVLLWERSLASWLASLKGLELTSAQWSSGVILSSVLIGGLLEAAKVKVLLQQMASDLPVVGRRPYAEFHQRMGKFGDFHCQRWFLDPITELLFLRRPKNYTPLTVDQQTKAIQALLQEHGTPQEELPKGLNKLLKHATARWHQHSARVDIEIVQRKVQSHALHERSWNRLFRQLSVPSDTAPPGEAYEQPLEDEDFLTDFCLLYPWFLVVHRALDLPPKTPPQSVDVNRVIKESGIPIPESHRTYVNWIVRMLQGHNATNDRLAVSTIKRLSDAVIPQVLSRLGDTSPADLSDVDLVELYEEIVYGTQGSQRVNLAKGLREFHLHLVRVHGKPSLKSLRETLGEDAGLEPVDANPISFEEYYKAKAYLERQIQQGGDRELNQIAKLSMMLAFRAGMRRWEIFGLRLKDVTSINHLELIIRPHEERRLKTEASQRIIPARLLLPPDERRELQAWLQRRFIGADIADDTGWVFDVPRPEGGWTRLSAETTADRIIKALSHATGQPTKIHQLRHSFATWMYLALRAPDYQEVLTLFEHLPETSVFLKRGKRLRSLLINRPGPTSRAYGYVVARLLGHSSPLVSLTSYIHSTEFIHRALAIRTANQLSPDSLRGVANLKSAWGNRLLETGIEHLLNHVRAQHARKKSARISASNNTEHLGTKAPGPSSPRGRPKKMAPVDWIPLADVHGLLHLYSSTQDAIENICEQVGSESELGQRIVDRVRDAGVDYGFERRGIRPLAYPEFSRKDAQRRWSQEVEPRLKRAFALDAQKALAGALVHLQHYNPSKRDVVFKGVKEKENLNKYMTLLTLMELKAENIAVLLRKTGEPEIPPWARKALGSFVNSNVRCVMPPVAAKAASYKDWVGLQLLDSDGLAWSGVTRGLMFLAYIVRGLA